MLGTNKSKLQILVELGDRHTLFHTPDMQAHAEVKVDKHHEVWPIDSTEYRQLLTRDYFRLMDGFAEEK